MENTDSQITDVIAAIVPANAAVAEEVQQLLDQKTKPRRSLGFLEDLACKFAAARHDASIEVPNAAIVVMAADHGCARQGVSAYPSEVTGQMVANFAAGGAAINVLTRQAGIRMEIVDMGVLQPVGGLQGVRCRSIAPGTADFTQGPAMTVEQVSAAIQIGIDLAGELADSGISLIGLGEMGIGSTTSASALAAAFLGLDANAVTGHGTGIDEAARDRKIRVVRKALRVNGVRPHDPLATLAALGGFEIAGLCGVVLGAAARKVPIVADGFITGAAALTAHRMNLLVADYLFAAHCSAERGHRIILDALELRPILEFDMRLGEGTGAALAIPSIQAAVRILREMATFGDAGVTDTGR